MHVLAGTDARTCGENAVHCEDGCSALQERMQCTAGTDAVHCGSGCSALRLRWVKQKDLSCGVLPSRQRLRGVLSIPRALPPVTHSSALQAPERMWSIIRGRILSQGQGFILVYRLAIDARPWRGDDVAD